MANKEFTGLTAASALAAADLFAIEQGGNSRKASGAQLQALASFSPGFIAARWYFLQTSQVTGVAGQDTIQLTPFIVPAPITISDLGCRVTTALAANNLQLAIYANNPTTVRPTGNALAVTGSISTASAAAVSADVTGADVPLTPGIYWAAVNHSGATSIVTSGAGSGGVFPRLVGGTTLAALSYAASSSPNALTVSQSFGTWPDLTSASFAESIVNAGVALYIKAA